MRSGLLLLRNPDVDPESTFAASVARFAQPRGLELREVGSAEACVAALASERDVLQLVVISPDWSRPLLAARRIAREHEVARFLIVAAAGQEPQLRREAIVGAPPGGRWAICSQEHSAVERAIVDGIQAFETQRRLRTTLDRVNHDLRAAATLDPREYRRLVASDRYLASVLESAHDAIVSLDLKQNVVSWNRAAERLFGIEPGFVPQMRFASLFEDSNACAADLDAAIDGQRAKAEWTLHGSSDIEIRLEAALDAVKDETGATTGLVVILRDVTERHAAARALRQASEQKDEFLAMLSHELRNPLAPIRTSAELLSRVEEPGSRSFKLAEIIARQATHMAALVEDLLDVASVGRGLATIERREVPLDEALTDAIEQARGLIDARGQHLAIDIAEGEFLVSGDRRRLTQIFCNVLTNSAKYTPVGGDIRVTVRRSDEDVEILVVDNGAGIDRETLPRVFDLFSQGHRTADRAQGGLGIGLAIVKSMTELHGGDVRIASNGPGTGTTVRIRLPLLIQQSHESLSAPAEALVSATRLNVMVVDDNEDAARTLGQLLEAIGHDVDVEIDPREALRRAAALSPDVFILDIGMPYLDGYELARRLLAQHGGKRPILIALTGYGQPADKEQAMLAGFDHHLVKPLDPAKLQSLLRAPLGVTRRDQ